METGDVVGTYSKRESSFCFERWTGKRTRLSNASVFVLNGYNALSSIVSVCALVHELASECVHLQESHKARISCGTSVYLSDRRSVRRRGQ
jgi:hypothetical protein